MNDSPTDSCQRTHTCTAEEMGDKAHNGSGADRNRGNVLLAAAMVLAGLVVLAAVAMTLAPTGSDGVTSPSADQADFSAVESGLAFVFVENNDTLDPAYDPSFDPPETDDPPPLDHNATAQRLESQPFTDEQVTQVQSLLDSLARLDGPGTISSLDPIEAETHTGTLVRVGIDDPYSLADPGIVIENSTAVQDLELHLHRETLPTGPDNATTLSAGDWTAAAYHNTTSDAVAYQLGGDDPDGDWTQTAPEEDFHLSVHNSSINGEPVGPALQFDPGEAPFEVAIESDGVGTTPGIYGGLNIVAGGTTPADVAGVDDDRVQEVVTRPAFTATYIDATSTVTSRLTVETEYQAIGLPGSPGPEPIFLGASVETGVEDTSELDAVSDGREDVWLPDYTPETVSYNVSLVGEFIGGGTEDFTENITGISAAVRDDGGFEPCDGCLNVSGVGTSAVTVTPESRLADPLNVTVNATIRGDEISEHVEREVVDPYLGAETTLDPDEATIGDSVTTGLLLEPRKTGLADRDVATEPAATFETGPVQVATQLADRFVDSPDDGDRRLLGEALVRLDRLNGTEQTQFVDSTPDGQAALLGFDGSEQGLVASFFDSFDSGVPFETEVTAFDKPAEVAAVGQLLAGLPTAPDIEPTDIATYPFIFDRIDARLAADRPIDEAFLRDTHKAEVESSAVLDPPSGAFVELVNRPSKPTDVPGSLVADMLREFDDILSTYRGDPNVADDATLFDEEEAFTDRLTAFRNAVTGEVNFLPGWDDDDVDEIYTRLDSFEGDDFDPDGFEDLSRDQRGGLFLLGGAHETGLFDRPWADWADDAEALEAESPAETVVTDSLFDLPDVSVVDETALQNGYVERAAGVDRLVADWDILAQGTYTGYAFAAYSAGDGTTVTEPPQVADIDVSIDYKSDIKTFVDDGRIDNSGFNTTYPIVVDDPTDLDVEVTFFDGTTETNPGFVTYDVTGPSFDPDDADYKGPEDPGEFATTNDSTDTVTALEPTGGWTPENRTGPVVIEATTPNSDVTGEVMTTAIAFDVSGALGFGELGTSSGVFITEDSPDTKDVHVGVEYEFRHGGPSFNHPSHTEEVSPGEFDSLQLERETGVTFDRSAMEMTVDQDVEFTLANATATNIDEPLDLDRAEQSSYNGTGQYAAVSDDEGGGGGGDPTPDAPKLGALAVNTGLGGDSDSVTRFDDSGFSSAPDPDASRGDGSVTRQLTDGGELTFNGYSNRRTYVLYLGGGTSLSDGETWDWRSDSCHTGKPPDNEPNCEPLPIALVDFQANDFPTSTTLDTDHDIQVQDDPGPPPANTPTPTWTYRFYVNETDDEATTKPVTLAGYDNDPSITVTVGDEDDDDDQDPGDDPPGGGDAELEVVSLSASPSEGPVAEPITLTATVENTGNGFGSGTVEFNNLDGTDPSNAPTGDVNPGETVTVTTSGSIPFAPGECWTYGASLGSNGSPGEQTTVCADG